MTTVTYKVVYFTEEDTPTLPQVKHVSQCFVSCRRPQYFYKKQIPPRDKARYASMRSCKYKYNTNTKQILYKYFPNTIQILYN